MYIHLISSLLIALAQADEVAKTNLEKDLLIAEVRLWDGTKGSVQDSVYLVIDDGKIDGVLNEYPSEQSFVRVIDGTGLTALPGLFDGHVHLSIAPGAAHHSHSPQVEKDLLQHHMRAYLACGVTSILDPAVSASMYESIHQMIEDGNPSPHYHSLGPPISPKDGYPEVVLNAHEQTKDVMPSYASPDQIPEAMSELKEMGVDGVKILFEAGLGRAIWPTYSEEMKETIVQEAKKNDLPLYVHAMDNETHKEAIEMGPHAFVHGFSKVDEEYFQRLVDENVYVMPNLTVRDPGRLMTNEVYLNRWLMTLVVPELELQALTDEDTQRDFIRESAKVIIPNNPFPRLLNSMGYRLIHSKRYQQRSLKPYLKNTARAYEMGVPMVMGSDAGNWPVLLMFLHGPSSLMEMQLMVEASMSPEDVLISATQTAAKMLDVDDHRGMIKVGYDADLILVEGDPITDIEALWNIQWTVFQGEAKTPAEWMEQ